MGESYLLTEIVVLFGTAVAAAWLLRIVRAPSVLGFLLTGILIGPSGLRLIAQDDVQALAELGLVLLLFTVGLELSPRPLVRSGWRLIVAATLQFVVTAAATAGLLLALGNAAWGPAALLGAATALSSTAIVLKQLSDLGQSRTAAAVIVTGVLLLQDVIVIAVMLFLPLFSAVPGADWRSNAVRTLVGAGVLIALALFVRPVLPTVLRRLMRRGGRELLAMVAVLMACGGAWLAGLAGWSLALGSCVAGLLLAGTEMRHQLMADITPFRDVFNALFFISLGMLVDVAAVGPYLPAIAVAVVATLALKPVLAAAAVTLAGWPLRLGIHAGLALGTVSEFGYVLGLEASRMGLLPGELLQVFIAYAVGTMMVGALLLPVAEPLSIRLTRRAGRRESLPESVPSEHEFSQHVIVVGYGTNGQNLVRVLKGTHIPCCVIEMNPRLTAAARDAEVPVIVGDSTRLALLRHAGLDAARALVVAINDPQSTQRIVSQASAARPDLFILARTSYIAEIDALYRAGARDVISEDFETSIEISAHVLKQFGVPDNIVEAQIAAIRAGHYAMLRGSPADRFAHEELMKALETTIIQTFYLEQGNYACGRTLAELDLRARTGVTVIAIVRRGKSTTNPPADFQLEPGDILVLLGAHQQLDAAKLALTHQ